MPPTQVFVYPCSEVNHGTSWQEEMSKILIFDLHKFPDLVNLPAMQTLYWNKGVGTSHG